MSRRVSFSASAGVSSPQPMPTRFSRLPPAVPPVIPAEGFFLFFGFAPAYWDRAAIVPALSTSYPNAKAPLQSVMIANRTSPLCAVVARAPEVAIVLPTTRTASGSKSFHLPSFMVPPLVPALSTCLESPSEEPNQCRSPISTLPPSHLPRPRVARPPNLEADDFGRRRSQSRSQSPIRPSGETITIARKMNPMTVLKRPADHGQPRRRGCGS